MESNEKTTLFKKACSEWVLAHTCFLDESRADYNHLYFHTTEIIKSLGLYDDYLVFAEECISDIFKALTKKYFMRERHEYFKDVNTELNQYFSDSELDKIRI